MTLLEELLPTLLLDEGSKSTAVNISLAPSTGLGLTGYRPDDFMFCCPGWCGRIGLLSDEVGPEPTPPLRPIPSKSWESASAPTGLEFSAARPERLLFY